MLFFLTSAGNIFTFGKTKNGRCGVKNEILSDIKQIAKYEKEVHGDRLTIPYQLRTLSSKFITDIYVGMDFSLCVDKNKNVYCWGNNQYNVMALDKTKYRDLIIWEPVLHNFFNNNSKLVNDIKCGAKFVCFIDNKYQCYWSPPIDNVGDVNNNNNKITHFQSLYDNKYSKIKVQSVSFDDKIILNNVSHYKLILLDIDNKLMEFNKNEYIDIEDRLQIKKLDNILNQMIKL